MVASIEIARNRGEQMQLTRDLLVDELCSYFNTQELNDDKLYSLADYILEKIKEGQHAD